MLHTMEKTQTPEPVRAPLRRPARAWDAGGTEDVRVRYAALRPAPPAAHDAPVQMRIIHNFEYYEKHFLNRQPARNITKQEARHFLDFFGFHNEIDLLNRIVPGDPCLRTMIIKLYMIELYADRLPEKTAEFRKTVIEFIIESNKLYKSCYDADRHNVLIQNQYQRNQAYRPSIDDQHASQLALHRLAYSYLAQHPLPIQQAGDPDPNFRPGVGKAKPLNQQSRDIPVLPFTKVQAKVPPGLAFLMRDIYWAWRLGRTFDKRSRGQRRAQATTSSRPGALRSYHTNMKGSLPSPVNADYRVPNDTASKRHMERITDQDVRNAIGGAAGAAVGRGKALHDDYKAHSKMEGGATLQQTDAPPHPVGYAEYTGIGYGGDPQDCKIVFDYIHGKLFLTQTHYQFYTIEGGNVTSVGQNPVDTAYSPWIQVDMEH